MSILDIHVNSLGIKKTAFDCNTLEMQSDM